MKPGWCRRELVVAGVYYTVCSTPALFEIALKHIGIAERDRPPFISRENMNATCWEFERPGEKLCKIVCIRAWEGRDAVEVAGLLVHEAVHIWQSICKLIGEAAPSPEFEAYSIQAIAQELMLEFRKQVAK